MAFWFNIDIEKSYALRTIVVDESALEARGKISEEAEV